MQQENGPQTEVLGVHVIDTERDHDFQATLVIAREGRSLLCLDL